MIIIHNQLMTFVNPEISCIRMGSGPALFGLARFYCSCTSSIGIHVHDYCAFAIIDVTVFDPLSVGVTFSESWNTNSELNTELAYEPSGIDGLKLTLNSSFLPSSG